MYKLWATIKKDWRIMARDRAGLIIMFLMPIILAIVIASVQNSTFELVNENKIPIIILNKDKGQAGKELSESIAHAGMFEIKPGDSTDDETTVIARMHKKDALLAIVIPETYTDEVLAKAEKVTRQALKGIIVSDNSIQNEDTTVTPLTLYYHPVLQESFRKSVNGALSSTLQIVQSKHIVQNLYSAVNEEIIPDSLESQIIANQTPVHEIPVSRDNNRNVPNATQHNIPAWTIFAMFFIVISLGSSIVREKQSGSFIRLRTMPTHFSLALISKQVSYIIITLLQAVVIFSIGIWLFPKMGLPALNLPSDIGGLFLVTLLCGWCAASFAICIGVFADTQEQANGFGSVSIVLLAAIGGLLVPSFVMPSGFQFIMRLSPLHWCLEAYYGLFLEGGKLGDIIMNVIPLLVITLLFQLAAVYGLRRRNLL
jgi:ABC-2 type transport system permease protein